MKICKSDGCYKGKSICCKYCDERDTCDPKMICDDDPKQCGVFVDTECTDLTALVPTALNVITDIQLKKKQFEEIEKEMKHQILEAMKQNGIKSFKNDYINITYVAPTERKTLDSTKLKKDHPEIVEQYQKTSKVSESVRIKVNE